MDFLTDPFLWETVIQGLLFGGVLALLSLGLNLVFGVIDVVWICYAELVMVGMYAIWWLHVPMGMPLVPAMAAGIVVAGVPLGLQRWRLRARTRTLEARVKMLETAVEERTRSLLGPTPPPRPPAPTG